MGQGVSPTPDIFMQQNSLSKLLYKRARLHGEANAYKFVMGKKLTDQDLFDIMQARLSELETVEWELKQLA